MEKWFIKNKKADFSLIAKQYHISEILARLIVNRNISSKEELNQYLHGTLQDMNNPYELKDVRKASNLLIDKIREGKRIRVVGDYDVDGVVATYVLYTALKRCGANVDYEIPDRMKDGYGINISIIDAAYAEKIDTIITCDNGIAAINQVKHAKELGMTVIITDHHDIPFVEEGVDRKYIVPEADAVINPKQLDCTYPFEGICGATVAFKLIQVLYEECGIEKWESDRLIEFVSIATVCDVMDLVNENRIIVKHGLKMLSSTSHLGLKALIEESKLNANCITVYHLGFIIGPCINASGRLESAKVGLRLLLSEDENEARLLAKKLKNLNDERKDLTSEGLVKAVEIIENSEIKSDKVIVVYIEDCHESLAGIIAGRIKEKYNKPTIVLTKAEEGVKGSARSIEEYNMFEELNKCKHLLSKFGGHPMAAGLSLEEENIELLRKELNGYTTLTDYDLQRKVSFDMVLPFQHISYNLIDEIGKLEPYGKGNTKPLFAIKDVNVLKAFVLGANRNVIKLTVRDESSDYQSSYSAMIFGDVEGFERKVIDKYGEEQLKALYQGIQNMVRMDLVFYPDINEYQGNKNIQVIVQNYR
ncbi:single-stranded-DNA-specific exonuclease RecJ [Anaeromicropila herbilytica]|uniref:Single-stranded-DNA-specific exonuclease RecJ n=1 Tax=Anaeromicropila herbilytica TaxID=2785025 RepID=A0A7R7EJG6_9FIRM|nr:single-stranded-DNA-specific exonuclease RecJ [Anaeromicropila herbilytica]BCN29922.1 single-stranded-DNA-specific exonuclease RecJ [Anaeromicropila herbilytica]